MTIEKGRLIPYTNQTEGTQTFAYRCSACGYAELRVTEADTIIVSAEKCLHCGVVAFPNVWLINEAK